MMLGLMLAAFAAAPASANVEVSSNEGPFGQFVPGDPGTLIFRTVDSNTNYRVEYRPATDDYEVTSLAGVFVHGTGAPADAGIQNGCSGIGTAVLVCPEALTGRAPYRLHFHGGEFDTSTIALRGDGNVVTATAFPALAVDVFGDDAGTTFENDTGTAVTFEGGSSTDIYRMGTGVEHVSTAGGIDTVDYSGYGANRCVTATFDGVADDTVHSCSGGSLNVLLESGENVEDDVEKIIGGSGVDRISGNALPNEIRGGGGNDDLSGEGGVDTLLAEAGGARMTGGPGADVFDVPTGGSGTISYADKTNPVIADFDGVADDGTQCPGGACEGDQIDADATVIEGGSSADMLTASATGRSLIGGDGGDTLTGGGGEDTLEGQGGNDTLNGAGANDTIRPGPGDDTYDGGPGIDLLDYDSATTDMSLSIAGGSGDGEGGLEDVPTTIEDLKSGGGDDVLVGDSDANRLLGGHGDDTLDGKGGNDILQPNRGNITTGIPVDFGCDVSRGGADNDTFDTGPLNDPSLPCRDVIDYSDHAVGVNVSLALTSTAGHGSPGENDTIASGTRLDVIGTDQPDTIAVTTAIGDHTLDGRGGLDNLTGGPSDDTLIGGLGDDVLNGGTGGSDTASYSNYSVPVTADLDGVDDDGATGTGEADELDGIDNLTGGTAPDQLTGDATANWLSGGDGGDTLNGLDGGDTLDGGAGANVENGGDGDDDITGGPSGGNSVDAGAGADDVNVRNSAADSVVCGPDADAVVADEVDTADGDCESVDRGLPPPQPDPPSGEPGPAPPAEPAGPAGPAGPGDTPADVLAPRLAIGPRGVRLSKKGVATLTLSCPAGEVSCRGTVSLASAKKVRRPGQSRRKAKRLTLGKQSFTAAGGKTVKVAIKLKRADLALLKRLRKLSTKATADVSDAAGNRARATAALTLLAPR